MSALRPHIAAARAYEAACNEMANSLRALGNNSGFVDWRRKAHMHKRAAEIMEAEEAAEYQPPKPPARLEHDAACPIHVGKKCCCTIGYPVQQEGC
ncbi:hypothetical protein HRJ34_15750 [Rhizorhabdus wittichii]|uniref:Uncharacterized protein n=1 Tax=Rhizorhabdus wittichii TaxID=160791 RepID=A0A975CYT1_9SPHN|nr:hypothetical protein [Rhizorhabdus wittichii]QTH19818.1 hypothetical protein HRJ34_15750 [Rhizorhabdus wittichii]